ncbi:MAG: glycosyltransferase family 39 protein [Acidobacteria bacterium]|nr:glycosyltransferase family 39 protein [Acidobacteriota bacterium]
MTAGWKRRDTLLLALIVTGGAVARFYGLAFGLPHQGVRPDELTLIARVMNFFSWDLNPRFFSYPSLLMYILFAAYNTYFWLGLALGRFQSISDLIAAYARDPSSFYLISRGISALFGTLSILAVYKVAFRLFGKVEALLAACFLAFAYLHVRDSHFGTTDVPVTFFVIASYVGMGALWDSPSTRHSTVAGLFAGLAASTKYMGVLLWAPMLLARLLAPSSADRPRPQSRDWSLILFGLAFAAAFLAGTPFALVEATRIRSDFAREVRAVWAFGYPLPPGWIYHLTCSLRYGLGVPLFGASLAGCFVLLRRDWRKASFLLSFPLLYYTLMGKGNRDFVRYAIPLVPFLCVTAAVFLAYLHTLARRRLSDAWGSILLAAAACLLLVPSIVSVVRFDSLLSMEDTRVSARRYVERLIPAGSTIAEFSASFGELELSPTATSLQKLLESAAGTRVQKQIDRARWNDVQAGRRAGYELWRYDPETKRFVAEGGAVPGNPDYLIVEDSPLRFYPAKVPPEIRDLTNRGYVLKKSFLAYGELSEGTIFNEMDALYIPFAGFAGYERPGPNIFIYQRAP